MSSAGLAFVVYLMYQVDTFITVLNALLHIFVVTTIAGLVIFGLVHIDSRKESWFAAGISKVKRPWIIMASLLIVLNMTIPNSETVKYVAVAYGASEVLQSDAAKAIGQEISSIASKTSKVIQKKLDESLTSE